MKKYYVAISLLVLLCIVSGAVFIALSPDTIPAHYNYKGEVDRFGSKYENLLFPIVTLLLGAFFMISAKKQREKSEQSNEKTMLIAATVTVAFFNAMTLYLGVKALFYANGNLESFPSIGKFIGVAIGALFCLLGNIMPKVRRNSMFGLRTKWSRHSDSVWQKSQRFAGFASVILGLVAIISAIFLSDMWILLSIMLSTLVWIIMCISASYRFYRGEINHGEAK